MSKRIWVCAIMLFMICKVTPGQVIMPYLQSPSDTSIWISWKTSSNLESKVIYGTDSLALQNEEIGNCQVLSDAGYDTGFLFSGIIS
jgi:hypothetical protein